MTARWRLLVDQPRPGWENMAIDCALLDLADTRGMSCLRLYRWRPACLSFGRHEPAARRYDRSRIEALRLDCVRRPTGGRAVWHARELTYAVTAPLALFGGLKPAYAQIHAMLAAALRRLGARPELAGPSGSRPLPPSAGPCFSAPVGGEVLLAGRKVVGSAQLRRGDALLQHGSLLLEDDQSLLRGLAGLDTNPSEVALSAVLGRSVAFEEAAAATVAAAESLLGWTFEESGLPPEAAAGAARQASQFQDPEWTWQR